jgi:hypothetical protein
VRRLTLALLCALPVAAGDLTGMWIGQVPARRNTDKVDIAFQFEQQGTKLTGKLYGDYRSSPIVSGTVSGELVTFVVVTEEQAGNEINQNRVRFTGRLVNGELELTRDREASVRAGSAKAVTQMRDSVGVTFRLKKLL